MTTSLVGPAPSAPAQAPAAFVSVTCYGNDAALALARDHEAALGAGATDVSFPKLGDETVAITSTRTGGTTVYVRRGASSPTSRRRRPGIRRRCKPSRRPSTRP